MWQNCRHWRYIICFDNYWDTLKIVWACKNVDFQNRVLADTTAQVLFNSNSNLSSLWLSFPTESLAWHSFNSWNIFLIKLLKSIVRLNYTLQFGQLEIEMLCLVIIRLIPIVSVRKLIFLVLTYQRYRLKHHLSERHKISFLRTLEIIQLLFLITIGHFCVFV